MNPEPHPPTVPPRTLGFWSIWALGVGAVVGDGIFVLLGQGIEKAGPSAFAAFFVAGVFQMFLMIALGELAVGMPDSGAMSAWVGRLVGPWWGFLAGFSFAIGWVFAGGSVGLAIGKLTCWYFPGIDPAIGVPAFGILFLTLFATLSAWGTDLSMRTQLLLVILLVGIMAAFALIGAKDVRVENYSPFMPNGWSGFWAAVPLGTYAYLGAVTLATAGGECRNPRDLPRALVWSSVTFLVVYTTVQAVVQGIIAPGELSADISPVTAAADKSLGRWGGHVLNLAGWIAAATTLLMGTVYAPSRIFMAQSRAGLLPGWLGRLHSTRKTPVNAIILVWICSVILILLGARDREFYYEAFSLQLVLAWMVSWGLALLAAVYYRRKHPAEVRALPWRQPLYPLFPLLGLAGIVVVTYFTFESVPESLLFALAWLVPLLVWHVIRNSGRRPPTP